MKKILLLLCAVGFTFMSCSKDDDNPTPAPVQDPLVGIWKYHKLFRDDVEAPLSACEKEEIFNCSSNGTYTYAYKTAVGNNCETERVLAGVWSNAGNGVYEFAEEMNSFDYLITIEGNTFFYTYYYATENVTEKYVYIRE